MTYDLFVTSRESPDGRDNDAGSGAFSKYQFMPATAAELAQKTGWGQGLTPATVKDAVMSDPTGGRAKQLFDLYNGRSKDGLATSGLPTDNASMLALHRFGQGGGVSLLKAAPGMSVRDWVNSVNWGPGVAADAVIRQNRLDRYNTVGDLRRGFIGLDEPQIADAVPQGRPAPTSQPPLITEPAPPAALDPVTAMSLAEAFSPQPTVRKSAPKRLSVGR